MIEINEMLNSLASDINNSFQQLQHHQQQTFGGLMSKFHQTMTASLCNIETTFSLSEHVSTGN